MRMPPKEEKEKAKRKRRKLLPYNAYGNDGNNEI
jgi:hypothetical protein